MSQKQSGKQRAQMAINAMKNMGFPGPKAKDVLKNLLKLYDNKWEYIEDDNYVVLVDAILDYTEPQVPEPEKKTVDEVDSSISRKKEAVPCDEPEPYKKRVRPKQEEQRPSTSNPGNGESTLKKPKLEADAICPSTHRQETVEPSLRQRILTEGRTEAGLPQTYHGHERETASLRTYQREKWSTCDRTQKLVRDKEPKIEPDIVFELPIAMICPPSSVASRKEADSDLSNRKAPDASETSTAQNAVREDGKQGVEDVICKSGTNGELLNSGETCATNIDIASSEMGEVKLSLSFNSAFDHPNFHMPSLDSVLKKVEERCLKAYKFIHPPEFSLMNLMKEMCQCALELGTESSEDKQENLVRITPTLDSLKTSSMQNIMGGMFPSSSNGSPDLPSPQFPGLVAMNGLRRNNSHNQKGNSETERGKKIKVLDVPEPPPNNSRSLVVVRQHEPALGDIRPLHDPLDVTKGEERVRISLLNEVNSAQYPPSFYYIPQNIVYQNAYVNFSLARIGDENCCSDCFGNCLSASIPCACARETGGEYAYTPDGLIKTGFLNECRIAMNSSLQKDRLFYCQDCPLERAKNEVNPDPCKGHLVRKFIKECWSKCGCNKQCGNRVVQRGITCNLQVFYTDEGKGWGLRTLDELPKGTFVCEYVGEVLTNMELYDRTIQTTGNARHTYPVLLDADWGSEGVLKDEEALCLDATFYGNVARFINHRCFDANLVEIPVEVETPDHHYYHLAFFTTRKVEAFEELTWDYGIDFDDHNHPVKAFRCLCRSKYCRDMKRRTKSRSSALVVR